VFTQLCETDWGAIGVELLAFAAWRAQNYRWASGQHMELAPGISLADVVQRVIEKTLSGERQWDPTKGPLVPWLKDQVKSVLDALAKSAPHRHEVPALEGEDGAERVGICAASPPPNPEEHLLQAERVNALFQAVSGEQALEEVLEAVMNGCEPKPRYLAAELGVPVEDINNRLKRLRRRVLREDIA
jgi:DNA-directed RNA polymerase specialized sigma24 family protein